MKPAGGVRREGRIEARHNIRVCGEHLSKRQHVEANEDAILARRVAGVSQSSRRSP